MHSGKFCASCEIKSLGPKRSIETTFQKNGYLEGEKKKGVFGLKVPSKADPRQLFMMLHKAFFYCLCEV